MGYLLVGNDGRDNVEVYDPFDGNLLALFGQGLIIMPNSVTTGPDGNIYVTDSRSHRVWVFDADYNFLKEHRLTGRWGKRAVFSGGYRGYHARSWVALNPFRRCSSQTRATSVSRSLILTVIFWVA